MLRHVEDDGEVSVVVTNDGQVLLVCDARPKEHMWLLDARPVQNATADSRERVASALRDSPTTTDRLYPGTDALIATLEEPGYGRT